CALHHRRDRLRHCDDHAAMGCGAHRRPRRGRGRRARRGKGNVVAAQDAPAPRAHDADPPGGQAMGSAADTMTAARRLEAVERRHDESRYEGGEPDAEESQLEADNARTRAEMDSTIDALRQKLSPAALSEKAGEVAYEATIGKVEDMVHETEHTVVEAGHW